MLQIESRSGAENTNKRKMPSRKGTIQSFKTRVAANLNWLRRCILGVAANTQIHTNIYWIRAHPNYLTDLTPEQRKALELIVDAVEVLRKAATNVDNAVQLYYQQPKTLSPKRERQKALRAAKTSQEGG